MMNRTVIGERWQRSEGRRISRKDQNSPSSGQQNLTRCTRSPVALATTGISYDPASQAWLRGEVAPAIRTGSPVIHFHRRHPLSVVTDNRRRLIFLSRSHFLVASFHAATCSCGQRTSRTRLSTGLIDVSARCTIHSGQPTGDRASLILAAVVVRF